MDQFERSRNQLGSLDVGRPCSDPLADVYALYKQANTLGSTQEQVSSSTYAFPYVLPMVFGASAIEQSGGSVS